jgi:methyl-accepting chemotaxis protein
VTLSIRQTIALLTLTGVVAAAALGSLGLWGAYRIQDSTEQINVGRVAIRNHMEADMMRDALRADVLAALYFAPIDPARRGEIEGDLREHASIFRAKMDANQKLELSDGVRSEVAEAKPELDLYISGAEHASADAELGAFIERFDALIGVMERISTRIETESAARSDATVEFYARIRTLLLSGVALTLAVVAFVGWSIARQIGAGVQSLTAAAREAAAGNLMTRADATQANELGVIAAAFNRVVEQLGSALVSIARSAQALGATASNISAVSQSVTEEAEATTAQAAQCLTSAEVVSLRSQTASSSVEQFSISIHEIAQSASKGSVVAERAVEVARDAHKIVSQLAASSTSIEAILRSINTIAEQTNMLALNATIEAARAGDAGRGFAVVANEVKELAKQTSKATGQIAKTIDQIREDATNANGALDQIERTIEEMNSMQATIAAAVEEQSATTTELTTSISSAAAGCGQIATTIATVQQSAESATQSGHRAGAEAQQLTQIAAELQGLVSRFRFENATRA